MTQARMTEMLSEALCVSMEEAEAALVMKEWNLPDAARLVQQRTRAREIEAARARESARIGGIKRFLAALRSSLS